MYADGRVNVTISYVAIDGHELFTWTEVCEGVHRNVICQCVSNSLEQTFQTISNKRAWVCLGWMDRAWGGDRVCWVAKKSGKD